MNIDFNKFLELLESNHPLSEGAANSALTGKTYAEMSEGIKWGYIPHPKDGHDYGRSKTTKLFVRELGEQWDILLFRSGGGAEGAETDKKMQAAAKAMHVKLGGNNPPAKSEKPAPEPEPENQGMIKNILNLQALTESMFGTGRMVNEAAKKTPAAGASSGGGEKIEGDKSMLGNTEYTVQGHYGPFPFEQALKLCVSAVTGKGAEGSGTTNLFN